MAMRTRPPLIRITLTVMSFPMQIVSFSFLDNTNIIASFQSDLITDAPSVSRRNRIPSAASAGDQLYCLRVDHWGYFKNLENWVKTVSFRNKKLDFGPNCPSL